jgi:serine/threonine protein kinase
MDNIMLKRSFWGGDELKLVDFGIARPLGSVIRSGTLVNNPPETLAMPLVNDKLAERDLWQMGIDVRAYLRLATIS